MDGILFGGLFVLYMLHCSWIYTYLLPFFGTIAAYIKTYDMLGYLLLCVLMLQLTHIFTMVACPFVYTTAHLWWALCTLYAALFMDIYLPVRFGMIAVYIKTHHDILMYRISSLYSKHSNSRFIRCLCTIEVVSIVLI